VVGGVAGGIDTGGAADTRNAAIAAAEAVAGGWASMSGLQGSTIMNL
jgi:hypothetical protein